MKTHPKTLLAATAVAIALFAAAPAEARPGTSRGFENGGKFYRFDPVVAEFNESGRPFRIVGLCQSACTLFLSIRNVCVEPRATFQFHAGNDGNGNISEYATRHMQRAYNAKLRRFVIENGYMETFKFHTISGIDMIEKFGYPVCETEYADVPDREDRPYRSGRTGETFGENLRNNPLGEGLKESRLSENQNPLNETIKQTR
jgi:hypothetical protein